MSPVLFLQGKLEKVILPLTSHFYSHDFALDPGLKKLLECSHKKVIKNRAQQALSAKGQILVVNICDFVGYMASVTATYPRNTEAANHM